MEYVIIIYMKKIHYFCLIIFFLLILISCTSNVSMNVLRPAEINIPSKRICALGYIACPTETYIQIVSDSLTRKIDESEYFDKVYSYKQCENIIQAKSKYYSKFLSKDRLLDEICSYFNEATVIKVEINESYSEDAPPPKKAKKINKSENESSPVMSVSGYKNGQSTGSSSTSSGSGTSSSSSDSSSHVSGYKNGAGSSSSAQSSSNTENQEQAAPAYHYGRQKITIYFSIIDAKTQSVIRTKTYTDNQEDSCPYENYVPGIHDRYKMALKSFENIFNLFVKDITPHRENVSVSFISDKNFTELDSVHHLFNSGYYEQALAILKDYATTEYGNDVINAKASYNYGMVLALIGEYDESAVHLLRAYKLQSKNSKYRQGIEFLKKEKANADRVKSQLSK